MHYKAYQKLPQKNVFLHVSMFNFGNVRQEQKAVRVFTTDWFSHLQLLKALFIKSAT